MAKLADSMHNYNKCPMTVMHAVIPHMK